MDNYSIAIVLATGALLALYGVAMWQDHKHLKRKRQRQRQRQGTDNNP